MVTDHANAKLLGEGLQNLGFSLTRAIETNMVWVDTSNVVLKSDSNTDKKGLNLTHDFLQAELSKHGIRVFGGEKAGEMRWVVHHQTPKEAISKVIDVLAGVLKKY